MAKLIFMVVDDDNSGKLCYEEFEPVLVIAQVAQLMMQSALIRTVFLTAGAEKYLHNLEHSTNSHPVVVESCREKCKILEERVAEVQADMSPRPLFGWMEEVGLDRVLQILIMVQAFWVTCWGSFNPSWHQTIRGIATGFTVIHVVFSILKVSSMAHLMQDPEVRGEMLVSRAAALTWSDLLLAYLEDHRQPYSSFRNGVTFRLTCLSTVAGIGYWAASHGRGAYASDEFCDALFMLMNLNLFKIFFINRSFCALVFAFWRGVRPIGTYAILLLIVMYIFSVVAHDLFANNVGEGYAGVAHWDTHLDSILTMSQVWLGAEWNILMDLAAKRTSRMVYFFFILYYLMVGVLFSQLFIGIIVSIFQRSVRLGNTSQGRAELILRDACVGWSDYELGQLQEVSGRLAAIFKNQSPTPKEAAILCQERELRAKENPEEAEEASPMQVAPLAWVVMDAAQKNHNDWFFAHKERHGKKQRLKRFTDGNGGVSTFNIATPFDELKAAATAETMAACTQCISWLRRSLDEMLQESEALLRSPSFPPEASSGLVSKVKGAIWGGGESSTSAHASIGELVASWHEGVFEAASAQVHIDWIERNKYALGDHTDECWLPYEQLSDSMKEYDRIVVRGCIECMRRHGWLPSQAGDAWEWISKLRRVELDVEARLRGTEDPLEEPRGQAQIEQPGARVLHGDSPHGFADSADSQQHTRDASLETGSALQLRDSLD